MTSSGESLTQKWLRQNVQSYAARDRVYSDVDAALARFPTLRPKSDVYTYDDGRTQLLLCVHGLLPISFRRASYNIPVAVWITRDYPRQHPIAYVVPTQDMLVKAGKHVDVSGRCTVEYLQLWERKSEGCNLSALLEALQDQFSREPPVYAKPPEGGTSPSPRQPGTPDYAAKPPPPIPSAQTARPPSSAPTPPAQTQDARPLLPPKPGAPPHAPSTAPSSSRHVTAPVTAPTASLSPPPPPPRPQSPQRETAIYTAQHQPRPSLSRGPVDYAPQTPGSHRWSMPPSLAQSNHYGVTPVDQNPVYAFGPSPVRSPPPPPSGAQQFTQPPPVQLQYAQLQPQMPAQPAPPPPPLPPTAHPQPAPPVTSPNFLDEETFDDQQSAPASALAAPAPPRPPNPELLRLHQQVHAKLTAEVAALSQSFAADAERLRAHQADLLLGEPAIRDEMARLEAVRDVCSTVAGRMRATVAQAERTVEELRRKGDPAVDELVCSTSIVHNQLINLVAEDNAIEDTIYHLHRALNTGRIDLDRFLRTARVLAEEQFTKRALIEKTQAGLPMGMAMGHNWT